MFNKANRTMALITVVIVTLACWGLWGSPSAVAEKAATTSSLVGAGECTVNSDCFPVFDDYCAKSPGNCDGDGTCQVRPDLCLQNYDPVCGCDGNTYSNACVAASNGVNVDFADVCSGGGGGGGGGGGCAGKNEACNNDADCCSNTCRNGKCRGNAQPVDEQEADSSSSDCSDDETVSDGTMMPPGGPCDGCPRKTNHGQCTRISCEPCCYACLGQPLPVCLE